MSTEIAVADDTHEGVAAIAALINKSERQVYYLCETGQIPAFKLGGKWHLRESTYREHLRRLEEQAFGRCEAASARAAERAKNAAEKDRSTGRRKGWKRAKRSVRPSSASVPAG
jgi:hypothetical protein